MGQGPGELNPAYAIQILDTNNQEWRVENKAWKHPPYSVSVSREDTLEVYMTGWEGLEGVPAG